MEFAQFDRVWRNLAQEDVVTLTGDPPADVEHLQMDYHEDRTAFRMVFGAKDGHVPDIEGADTLSIPREKAGEWILGLLHKLHIAPMFIFPIGRWRNLIEAVSPILAENETWMEIDSAATIRLKNRDPLECDIRAFGTMQILIDTILGHTEELSQGISLAAANAPLLIEIDPENGVLITTGNELLAGEIKLLGE